MNTTSVSPPVDFGNQIGSFETSNGRRFRVSRVDDRVLVSYEQQPAERTGTALELTVDGGDVVDSRWYSTWIGASADEHAAILDPTMELLAEHLESAPES